MDKMKNKIEVKEDIVDGDIGLDPEIYLNKKNHKIRINAFIDGDIYEELKKRAEAGEGKGRYQTLMNELLRQVVFDESRPEEIIQVSKSDLRQVVREFGFFEKKASRPPSKATTSYRAQTSTKPQRTAMAKVAAKKRS